jgi:hypothetical protein
MAGDPRRRAAVTWLQDRRPAAGYGSAMLDLLLTLAAAAPAARASGPRADLGAVLRSKDQALLDAIAPGDRALWDAELAPDAVYVDENGVVMDRARFLAELRPLPRFASGHIRIVDYQLRRSGDVALVIHRDDEREIYHGVRLHADYLMSETWVLRRGAWRLALVHAYVVAKDPPAITLPTSLLGAYVGRYRLRDGVSYEIRHQGDHLAVSRDGKTAQPLLAESTDVFFVPGQPRSRKIFLRGPDGRVVRMIDRREGEDLDYRRLP